MRWYLVGMRWGGVHWDEVGVLGCAGCIGRCMGTESDGGGGYIHGTFGRVSALGKRDGKCAVLVLCEQREV